MPDKPLWLDRLPEAVRYLQGSSEPWVDRSALESLLGVGRRRAQQLLSPIAKRRVGTSIVARNEDVVAHLQQIAAGEEAYYEDRRKRQLWEHLSETRQEWVRQPPLLVEVSAKQVRQVELHDFDGLPEGVELEPGSIHVRFRNPVEALQKLMALALAISRNRDAFDRQVGLRSDPKA